jgi:hypothetical protein
VPQNQRHVGPMTGKNLDEVFPNYDEIAQTFDKLEDMIDVSFQPLFHLLIGHGKQNTR